MPEVLSWRLEGWREQKCAINRRHQLSPCDLGKISHRAQDEIKSVAFVNDRVVKQLGMELARGKLSREFSGQPVNAAALCWDHHLPRCNVPAGAVKAEHPTPSCLAAQHAVGKRGSQEKESAGGSQGIQKPVGIPQEAAGESR